MADASLKKLLVKIGMSTTEWDTFVKKVTTDASALQQKAKASHDTQIKQLAQQAEKEKEKYSAIVQSVQTLEKQINGYKNLLKSQTLSVEKQEKYIATTKTLIAEEQHYLNILKLVPQAHDLDIQKKQLSLKLTKEEVGWQEQKVRLAAAQIVKPASAVQSAGAGVTNAGQSARLAQLEGQLAGTRLRSSMDAINGEMQATSAAYQKGELLLKEYVSKQLALLEELQLKKINLIDQGSLAQMKQIRDQEALGLKTKEIADAEVKVIEAKNLQILASERRRYEQQQVNLQKLLIPKAPPVSTAAQIQQMTRGIDKEQAGLAQAQIQAEMQANNHALEEGTLKRKEYVKQQAELQGKLHTLRMNEIAAEQKAILAQIKVEQDLGRMSAEASIYRAEVAEIQAKRRMIAEKSANEAALMSMRGPRAEGGILGKVSEMARFMVGGGLGVQMLAAVTAGNALYGVLEKVGEKLKEVLLSSSSEQQLREQFEKLATREGEDPTERLEKMRTATKGLVDDLQLFRVSNNFMQQSMKVSSEEVAKLTQLTVSLARAQGKDATQAVNALVRASLTGRTMMLAMVTGIDRQTLSLKGLGQGIDPVTKKTAEFQHTLEVMENQFKSIGEPQLTYKERMQQISVATENLYQDTAAALATQTPGLQHFMDFLGQIGGGIAGSTDKIAQSIADVIGPAFEVLTPILEGVGSALKAVWGVVVGGVEILRLFADGIGQVISLIPGMGDKANGVLQPLLTFKGFMLTLAQVITIAAAGFAEFALAVKLGGDLIRAATHHSIDEATKAIEEYNAAMDKVDEDVMNKLGRLQEEKENPNKKPEIKPAGPRPPAPEDTARLAKAARERLTIRQAQAKLELARAKDQTTEERRIWQEYYDDGLVLLEDYNKKRKELADQDLQAQLKEIEMSRQAKLAQLEESRTAQLVSLAPKKGEETDVAKLAAYGAAQDQLIKDTSNKRKLIEIQANTEIEAAYRSHSGTYSTIDRTANQDQLAAKRKYLTEAKAIDKSEFDYKKQKTEEDFTQGLVSAQNYLGQRKAQIQQEYGFAVASAQSTYETSVKNEQNLATLRGDLAKAEQTRQHEVTTLIEKETDIRLQAIKTRYEALNTYLQSALGLSQAQSPQGVGAGQVAVYEQLKDINAQRINALSKERAELEGLNDKGADYWDKWIKITTEINQAKQEQIKLNQEMQKAKDILMPIANIYDSIASAFGAYNSTLQKSLTQASKILQEIAKYRQQTASQEGTTGNAFKDVIHQTKGLFKKGGVKPSESQTPIEKFQAAVDKASGGVLTLSSTTEDSATKFTASTERFNNAITTSSQTLVGTFVGAINTASEALRSFAAVAGPDQSGAPKGGTNKIPGGFDSEFTQAFSSLFSSKAAPYSEGEEMPSSISASLPLNKTPKIFEDLNKSVMSSVKVVGDTGKKDTLNGKLSAFASTVGAVVGQVGGFVGSITGAKSAGGGALSGGMSGMALGANLGPIGAVVGGVGGAILGGITGNKAAQMARQQKKIETAFDNIVQAVQMGTTKLGDGIKQLQALRDTAISTLGGSKKGRKQLPAVLQGLDSQIQSLKMQQKQLLDQLAEQNALLKDPTAYRDIVSNLDQVIQKYQQFADAAAGSADKVALANQYLVNSLKAYVETQSNELRTSEIDAIQNAQQLNDLLVQRQQILDQAKRSEYDIMTAGSLTSQRTSAMQKVSQISDLRAKTAQQLYQLDQQIATAKYKYDTESKIFNLQMTSTQLQLRLIELQNQQSQLDMNKIAALKDVLGKISSVDLGSLTSADMVARLLGLATAGTTTSSWQAPSTTGATAAIPEGYYNTAGYNTSTPTNYQTGLPVPTPTGPTQQPNLPQYDDGGVVPETQVAVVHKNEEVLTPTDRTSIRNLVHSMMGTQDMVTANRVSAEAAIHSTAMARIAVESALIKSQHAFVKDDMNRIQALSQLLDKAKAAGGGAGANGHLETLLSNLYGVRGRYGAGGFNRENL